MNELSLLYNYLLVGAILFVLVVIGSAPPCRRGT